MQYKKSWASSNERIKARCKNRYFCCRGVRKTVCGHGRKGISLVAPHTRNALSRTARFSRVVVVTIIDRWIISESGGRGVGTGVRASEWARHIRPRICGCMVVILLRRPDPTRRAFSSAAAPVRALVDCWDFRVISAVSSADVMWPERAAALALDSAANFGLLALRPAMDLTTAYRYNQNMMEYYTCECLERTTPQNSSVASCEFGVVLIVNFNLVILLLWQRQQFWLAIQLTHSKEKSHGIEFGENSLRFIHWVTVNS